MQTQSQSVSEAKAPKLSDIKSLLNSAVWFRLHDSSMSNTAIAKHLDVDNFDQDSRGLPSAVFYKGGVVLGIRVNEDEVATFHLFQSVRSEMEKIADRVKLQERGALSKAIRPDWTRDQVSGRANSSPDFNRLCQVVELVIRRNGQELVNGHADETARTIMAYLAHGHGLAPWHTEVKEYTSDDDGSLRGTFKWNGRYYKFSAVPLSS